MHAIFNANMFRACGLLVVLLMVVPLSIPGAWPDSSRALTLEDRVAAQRAIEEVYWRHRIWPDENPTPKPPLGAVMPESVIRAKVESYLQMSNALERWWGRPITGAQLQAELDRMARDTRAPEVLRELFDSLGGDASLVAESLARQALAERLIRNWYANDERFHGVVRRQAEKALSVCHDVRCMEETGGQYAEMTARLRRDDDPGRESNPSETVLRLDAEQWQTHLDRWAARVGGTEQLIQGGRLSSLEETRDAYVVSAVLSQREGEIVTATTSWPKRTFDSWWRDQRAILPREIDVVAGAFALPTLEAAGCTNDTWSPTPLEVPDMRSRHTAVWTGAEMVVWGGSSGSSSHLNTGGRYNPSTDTWVPTSIGTNVPIARGNHTAVWTGTEMVVWGGSDGDSSRNDGGRYDPSTDAWMPTSEGAGAPAARYGHTGIWTGTEMIVWGGILESFPTDTVNTGGRYNPSTDSWVPTSTGANVPAARGLHLAVWTGAEMIVWGGGSSAGDLVSGGRYDPSTDSWTSTSTVAVPSNNGVGTAVWTGAEMIVWGGTSNTGGRYNPSTDSWEATSTGENVPPPRSFHTAVWTGTEMIIWGGHPFWSEGGRYDPSSDSWLPTTTSGAPNPRRHHTAVWTGSEMIVWGGDFCNGSCPPVSNTGGRYDPQMDSWLPTATEVNVPGARDRHAAVWTGAEMIVWGGVSGDSTQAILDSGGRYDPALGSWTPTSADANVPTARHSHTSTWTGREMIVWGGRTEVSIGVNDGARYDPLTDSWKPTSTGANVSAARLNHTAVWTGTEMVVWGGINLIGCCQEFLNTGGRYDPSTDGWIPTSTAENVPSGRNFHTAVWTGTQMIVWGGYESFGTSSAVNSGGRYTPATDTWTPTSTGPDVPPARGDFTAAWTGTEMIVWGGRFDNFKLNTGGRYAPSTDTWTVTSTGANVPEGRYRHSAVWTGMEMVVWGGSNDLWPWKHNTGGRYDPLADSWAATSTGADVPPGRTNHTASWTGSEMIVWGGDPPLSTAGRYCACPAGQLFYRDADGDGYGATSISSCDGSSPTGYVADQGDCNDAEPNVHAGAVEVNDRQDNQCPGDLGYGATDEISVECGFHDSATEFSCPPQPGATAYEAARSSTPDFSGDCVRVTTTDTKWNDSETPVPGDGFFYLVRALTPFVGSWGQDSTGAERANLCPLAPNVVDNGGMESWNSSTDLDSWIETISGGDVAAETTHTEVNGGLRAARLTRTGFGVLNIVHAGLPLIPGQDYRLDFAAKFSEALAGAVQVRIRNQTRGEELQDDGLWGSGTNFISYDLTTEYEQRALQFMVDPSHSSTDDFRLVIRHKAGAPIGSKLWIDEVTIRAQ